MTARFTLRTEVDFIALAPVVLGFNPANSLVMMTMGAFHARVDLPTTEEDIEQCIGALMRPVKLHGVQQVAFVIYGDGDHDDLKAALLREFELQAVTVVASLQVHDDQWRTFYGRWRDLDLSDNPIALEAQYHDVQPKYQTREEMAEYVRPMGLGGDDSPARALLTEDGVDDVLFGLNRENAGEAVKKWTDILRGLGPDDECVHLVAVVLAISAWLSGDGALAWVALDHCDEETNWFVLIHTVLDRGLNPAIWEDARADGV